LAFVPWVCDDRLHSLVDCDSRLVTVNTLNPIRLWVSLKICFDWGEVWGLVILDAATTVVSLDTSLSFSFLLVEKAPQYMLGAAPFSR
jgi:hypothetical protein